MAKQQSSNWQQVAASGLLPVPEKVMTQTMEARKNASTAFCMRLLSSFADQLRLYIGNRAMATEPRPL